MIANESSFSYDCLDWKKESIKKAVEEGIFKENDYVMMYNLDEFRALAKEACDNLKGLQTMAVKCNPVMNLMKEAIKCGLGAEVASFGELKIAERAGFEPSKIIFDSPIKTRRELEYALNIGCVINVDNFEELETIEEIVSTFTQEKKDSLVLGIRINPQVDAGTLTDLSTGVPTSKFGIGIQHKDKIIDAYRRNKWLKGVHIHIGSQGFEIDSISSAAVKVMELTKEINTLLNKQITFFNMGGGLSVNFDTEQSKPTFTDYANHLKSILPELFNGDFLLITEFGRSYWAKCGVVISNIEYTKSSGDRAIAVCHSGANMHIRTVYQFPLWKLRVTIFDKNGIRKHGDERMTDIAGPCCFAADVLVKERMLPPILRGEYVMVHDCGAYMISAYSHYNLRLAPPIYSFDVNTKKIELIKKGETIEEKIQFFS
ncbi:hypothetical protein DICPUDRAFT_152297 [Dictyostelium purpureum]|uniref:Orn/DAP/Arg decarboxylase 2 N-terminal domain-containing protein n=1 Tax=Dictyostelium purpureum TaxID=5786 RepID=F0ZKZ8_DICPU|nr:uncharacterized protein DICPUDRAFT_152297 [Dictyostelium purpureum]EGC35371.1 hypothetical protein DICPUDRAFT_152297 [Dictyostelium purpureum]|eukprot:XP_003288109.1 hypothetical protein DICPUDRAFT_152297 [Dictyostelium purpureum]